METKEYTVLISLTDIGLFLTWIIFF